MPEARNRSVGIHLRPSNVIRGNDGINASSRLRRPDGALELRETLRRVLRTLYERGRLCRGMVSLLDPDIDERERVIAALEQAGWVQAKAARLLGMTPRQIAYRIQTMKIRVKQF